MFKISEIGVLTTPCMDFFGDSAKTVFFCLSYIQLLNTFDDFGVSELSFSNLLIPFWSILTNFVSLLQVTLVDISTIEVTKKNKVKGYGSVNRDKWAAPLSSGKW